MKKQHIEDSIVRKMDEPIKETEKKLTQLEYSKISIVSL